MTTFWRVGVVCLFCVANVSLSQAQDDVYAGIRKSLVAISVTAKDGEGHEISGFGTGFIIHEYGYVLTAYHLKGDLPATSKNIQFKGNISDMTGNSIPMTEFDLQPNFDAMILKLADRAGGYTPVTLEKILKVPTAEIFTSGFASTCVGTATDVSGITCNNRRVYYTTGGAGRVTSTDTPAANVWATDLTINSGNSGSPVYFRNGHVIGIAKGKLSDADNTYYFVPIGFITSAFLNLPETVAIREGVQGCVAQEIGRRSVDVFNVPGGARAPSNGPKFEAVTADASVCYQAPPGWKIAGQVSVQDTGNNGGRGWIGPVTYAPSGESACVNTRAWSDSNPFGAGGWQYVALSGKI